MSAASILRSSLPLVLLVGALTVAGRLAADHTDQPGKKSPSQPQKAVTHPLAKSLEGAWNTKLAGKMSGMGTAKFALGVNDTVLLHDETSEHKAPDGTPVKTAGHGMYRFSEDGKTVTAWWIDNYEPEVLRLTGPATPSGFDISGETQGQGKFRIVLEATPAGVTVRCFMGASTEPFWTQTYVSADASPGTSSR